MSIIDLRSNPQGARAVGAERGLKFRGALPQALKPKDLDAMLLMLDLLVIAKGLSPRDLEIFEVVRRTRSVRKAVRELPADRPASRAYLQKRLRLLRERMGKTAAAQGARISYGVAIIHQAFPDAP